ncbi:MAG: hypothetical protein V3U78_04500 [Thiotrichaceae bacterium]
MKELAKIVFEESLTEQGLKDLESKYPANQVIDMSDNDEFKKARKIRTEKNKLVDAIKRRRIDVITEINIAGKELSNKVENIYAIYIDPFELEDKKRKEESERKAQELENYLSKQRVEISGMRTLAADCQSKTSAEISICIDAITNIDCKIFHKKIIHEAIDTKESVLKDLGLILANKIAFETSEKQRKKLEDKLAKYKDPVAEPVLYKNSSELQTTKQITDHFDQELQIWGTKNKVDDKAMIDLISLVIKHFK